MKIRWASDTKPWICSHFSEEKIRLTDITAIRNTLEAIHAIKDVDLQIKRTNTDGVTALKKKFPHLAVVLNKLEKFDYYRDKYMEPYLELRTRPALRKMSLGVELDKGIPSVSAALSKTFWPDFACYEPLLGPIKFVMACRTRLADWRDLKLDLDLSQPQLLDCQVVDERSINLTTGGGDESYWWSKIKYPTGWSLSLRNGLGEALFSNNLSRMLLKPKNFKWKSPGGVVTLKSSFGLNIAESSINPVAGVVLGLQNRQTFRDKYYLVTRVACGQLFGSNCPAGEFLTLAGVPFRNPVRCANLAKISDSIVNAEGLRDGLFGSLTFGYMGLFHPKSLVFGFCDGLISRKSSQLNNAAVGLGLGAQLSPDVTLEASAGVSPVSGEPLWDMRVNGNF